MSRRTRWILAALIGLLVVGGIARTIVKRKAEQAAITQSGAQAANGALQLGPADTLPARRAVLRRTIEVSGSLRAVDSAVIKARVAGELLQLAVREGDTVRQGQLIGRIDDTEYRLRLEQARQQAAAARAQWQIAQRTLDNNRALVAQGFISKTALDTSVSGSESAQATLQAAEANVRLARQALDDCRLISPLSGLVAQQFARSGERVAPEGRVLEVVDLSRLEVEAALRAEDIARVRVGTRGQLRVDGLDTPVGVRVARINPSADAGTRAVKVYLAVDTHPALRQGLFARGQLELGSEPSLVLPRSAIRQGATGPYVQAVRQQRVVHARVALSGDGVVDDAAGTPMVGVAEGLREGDVVLRESVGLLREGTPVQAAGR